MSNKVSKVSKVSRVNEWTKEEVSLIKKEGGKKPTIYLSQVLGRSTSAIRSKAFRIGKSLDPNKNKKSKTIN
jgi:hypothetical protein